MVFTSNSEFLNSPRHDGELFHSLISRPSFTPKVEISRPGKSVCVKRHGIEVESSNLRSHAVFSDVKTIVEDAI